MLPSQPPQAAKIVAVRGPLVIKKIPAALSNYSRVIRTPLNIVLHATDGHEGLNKDVDGAMEISVPLPKGLEKSFHYITDGNSATQCVEDQFIAWHARKKGNSIGIGIEMCGRAKQTREEWFDEVSLMTMQITARLCVELCLKHGIPDELVTPEGLLEGKKGITTHHFISQAFKQSSHTDPGPNFPLAEFIQAVRVGVRTERIKNLAATAQGSSAGFVPKLGRQK